MAVALRNSDTLIILITQPATHSVSNLRQRGNRAIASTLDRAMQICRV
jgi:hypothetical protein